MTASPRIFFICLKREDSAVSISMTSKSGVISDKRCVILVNSLSNKNFQLVLGKPEAQFGKAVECAELTINIVGVLTISASVNSNGNAQLL